MLSIMKAATEYIEIPFPHTSVANDRDSTISCIPPRAKEEFILSRHMNLGFLYVLHGPTWAYQSVEAGKEWKGGKTMNE